MQNADADLEPALERWRFAREPREWDDVLVRAGHPPRRRTLRRGVLAAIGAAVLAVAPASAWVASLRGDGDADAAGVTLTARFARDAPVRGTLTVRVSRVLVIPRRDGRLVVHVFGPTSGRRLRPRMHWRLDLGAGVTSARIRRARDGAVIATLCAPCGARSSGPFTLRSPDLAFVFNGQTQVELQTPEGTVREPLRLRRRR